VTWRNESELLNHLLRLRVAQPEVLSNPVDGGFFQAAVRFRAERRSSTLVCDIETSA
jgi:hypothetical protein